MAAYGRETSVCDVLFSVAPPLLVVPMSHSLASFRTVGDAVFIVNNPGGRRSPRSISGVYHQEFRGA
jgi:hypothetical protein